ncbi:MAG: UDP-N-acetylglucosamine 2-epimerase (non-hydrolyzing) [Phycisphaerales bacterium]|nr:MAG: UDP-N-acetylglucosamine 2-epimerase (non-hydrolyzing) [Phycisphaerales bacterium]
MSKILLVFGTRPEAIKLCPLVLLLRRSSRLEPEVCVTGQHRELLEPVLRVFDIEPDVNLRVMEPNQALTALTWRMMKAIDGHLLEHSPDFILVQGDTTSAFCAALVGFYHGISVGHVEAGLRTWREGSPFPEEVNRALIARLARFHFAPTATAKANLLQEGIPEDRIYVTGNTGIDALHIAAEKVRAHPPVIPGLPPELMNGQADRRLVVVTSHRRESFGGRFESICHGIRRLAEMFPDVAFVFLVHKNPNVRGPVLRLLAGARNIHLLEPLGYLGFVRLMERSLFIMTDSGGIQEEAPSLGKPVLVMRETTERPEGVEAGAARLVGTERDSIVDGAAELLRSPASYGAMAKAVSLYGDGRASERIARVIQEVLQDSRR